MVVYSVSLNNMYEIVATTLDENYFLGKDLGYVAEFLNLIRDKC